MQIQEFKPGDHITRIGPAYYNGYVEDFSYTLDELELVKVTKSSIHVYCLPKHGYGYNNQIVLGKQYFDDMWELFIPIETSYNTSYLNARKEECVALFGVLKKSSSYYRIITLANTAKHIGGYVNYELESYMKVAPVICKSRFSKGAKASEIDLGPGDKVKYKLLDGTIIDATIKSTRMTHAQCKGPFGFEAITHNNNELNFIDVSRIVSWAGKDTKLQ
jgi:hypothetical protein